MITRLALPLTLLLLGSPILGAQAIQADPSLPAYKPGAQVSGTIALVGHDTMEGMIRGWIGAFAKFHPAARIDYSVRDTVPEDRSALGPDTAEVFNNTDEPYIDKYGCEPFRIQVSMATCDSKGHIQAIGVFVNSENPISSITLAQLDAIYSTTRRRGYPADITTWGHLGLSGEWADKPIHFYGRTVKNEVPWRFRDVVLLDGAFKAAYREAPPKKLSVDVANSVAGDRYGIGFVGLAYGTDRIRALALAERDGGPIAQPNAGDVALGRYPLDRPFFIYVNRRPGQPLDPLVKEFLSFVLSREGQELVPKDGNFPIPPRIAAAERGKLD